MPLLSKERVNEQQSWMHQITALFPSKQSQLKLYVAGRFADKEEIGKKIKQLENKGYAITHDWTKTEIPDNAQHIQTLVNDDNKHTGYSFPYMRECATRDINGVVNADVLVVYMEHPNYEYRGTWTEIGCAIGLKKQIYIVMPDLEHPIRERLNSTIVHTKYNSTIGHAFLHNINTLNPFFFHPSIVHVRSHQDLEFHLAKLAKL
jgi:nucleoside 2-deoxyribosyltransferase